MIDNETFNKVYELATPVKKYLFSSSSSGERLTDLAKKYRLEEREKYSLFAITVGDIIFGFYKIEDTVPLLQQELGLDAKTAALLGADVLDFLAPLSDPNWQPPVEAEIEDNDNTVTVPGTREVETDTTPISTPTFITEPETSSTIIPQLRTMAGDMQEERSPIRSTFNAATTIDEPIYTSTQPTIERPATAAPSYTAPMYEQPKPNIDVPLEKPRWS